MSRIARLALGALALLSAPAPAATAVYDPAVTQTDLGDAGPDWFGRATVTDGLLTSVSATIAGVTHDEIDAVFSLWHAPDAPGSPYFPKAYLGGFLFETIPPAGQATTVLQFLTYARFSADTGIYTQLKMWALSPCVIGSFCGGGEVAGSYTMTALPASVPVPAAGALALPALAALGARRRRRRT